MVESLWNQANYNSSYNLSVPFFCVRHAQARTDAGRSCVKAYGLSAYLLGQRRRIFMGVYDKHPKPFLERLLQATGQNPEEDLCCAGFELEEWRCRPFADDLIGWLPDYGLVEEELQVDHTNAYEKLRQAAIRVYTSENYKKRGEVGEIALHAICRIFFQTIPISPRVFYKSSSNDVVKSFDLVHARFGARNRPVELY